MTDDSQDLEPINLAEPAAGATTWPEGWYADPWTAGQYRYWTGTAWSGTTHRWGPANGAAAGTTTAAWPSVPAPATRGYGWPGAPAAEVAPTAPPARRRGPIVAGVIALVALLIASGAIGYAINSSSQPERAVRVTPAPPTTAPATAPTPGAASRDPDRRALGDLVVRQADVGAARTVLLYPKGNRLDEPTLDLCNATFPSERLRTARLQLVDVDTANPSDASLSTEAVLYRNPAATVQAFAEVRRARAQCPHAPVASPADHSLEETEFQASPDGSWKHTPGVERLAYRMTIKDANGTSPLVTVYLRRGRALLGLYFPEPNGKQPPVASRTSIERIVGLFEQRMAALPASVVNGAAQA